MPVMKSVFVVVPKNPAIIPVINIVIDIGEIVASNTP